jgi:hypothetical protein
MAIQNNGKEVTTNIKEKELPRFLDELKQKDLPLYQRTLKVIDGLADTSSLDLTAVAELNGLFKEYHVPIEIDLATLLKAKLERTGLDKAIPKALGLTNDFFKTEGLLVNVQPVFNDQNDNMVRSYRLDIQFFDNPDRELPEMRSLRLNVNPDGKTYTLEKIKE